jgi:hypothetical protein
MPGAQSKADHTMISRIVHDVRTQEAAREETNSGMVRPPGPTATKIRIAAWTAGQLDRLPRPGPV